MPRSEGGRVSSAFQILHAEGLNWVLGSLALSSVRRQCSSRSIGDRREGCANAEREAQRGLKIMQQIALLCVPYLAKAWLFQRRRTNLGRRASSDVIATTHVMDSW